MNNKYKNLKVLHLVLEFPRWVRSRSWTYSAQLCLDDGLKAHGIECFTVNTLCLPKLRDLCRDKKFDQVWLEIVHQPLDEELLEWLAALAPVRLGFVPESLEYSEESCQIYPHLRERKEVVGSLFKYLTHVMLIDEKDALDLDNLHEARTMWWLPSISERFISPEVNKAPLPLAFFSGAVYGARKDWLENPELAGSLAKLPPSEAWTLYPLMYDVLQFFISQYIKYAKVNDGKMMSVYMDAWFCLRRKCFSRWLKNIKQGVAIVNLPSYVKAYAGRVVEGMSAGVPVLSWKIPDRPRLERLFENGREILLYSREDPRQLSDYVEKLNKDKSFAQNIADNALHKVKSEHTSEHRVEEILEWIENGTEPAY